MSLDLRSIETPAFSHRSPRPLERVREPTFDTYDEMMALMPVMRRSDTALVDLDDEEWEKGLAAIERAQAAGEKPWPLGMDLLVLR